MSVNAAVSKYLPDDTRADICQQIILWILEGDMTLADLLPAAAKETKRRMNLFSHFTVASLNTTVGHDEDGSALTLVDMIPDDYEPIISKKIRRAPGMT